MRELTEAELGCVSGGRSWAQRFASAGVFPGGIVGVIVVEYVTNSYLNGFQAAHGETVARNR